MPTPNPHELLARQRKTTRIADVIWEGAVKSSASDEQLVATIEDVIGCSPGWRASFARCAGEREPSDETWALVEARLRELLALRRTVRGAYEAAHG